MNAPQEAGAYVPRPGDWVTVRRWITPTTGERTLSSEHAGQVTDVQPRADGYRIWLNTLPDNEWIFTGYQFLGQGTDGRGPASLVTEIAPMHLDGTRISLTPDLTVLLDASQCIVMEVTDPAAGGEVLRRVTVTDVDAFKRALDVLHKAQYAVLAVADKARYRGPDERRRAEGRYTRQEAVSLLVDEHHVPRHRAVTATGHPRHGGAAPGHPARVQVGDVSLAVTFDGEYWTVQPATQTSDPEQS